jgi:hypothetical protein
MSTQERNADSVSSPFLLVCGIPHCFRSVHGFCALVGWHTGWAPARQIRTSREDSSVKPVLLSQLNAPRRLGTSDLQRKYLAREH